MAENSYNYRELAPMLADYVKEMGYTHVELLPIMEHPFDASWGYQVTGYYAPTARYGTPQDFMYFMDYMHEQGIGVILGLGTGSFSAGCLRTGMHLTEPAFMSMQDPRKGAHPHWGTLIYNYGRPEVIELPDCQCAVLGGQIPCRRHPDGCGGFHAVSGLRQE